MSRHYHCEKHLALVLYLPVMRTKLDMPLLLGGGRTNTETEIHHGVGIRLHHKKDAVIKAGDILAEVFVGADSEVEEAIDLIQSAYCIQ